MVCVACLRCVSGSRTRRWSDVVSDGRRRRRCGSWTTGALPRPSSPPSPRPPPGPSFPAPPPWCTSRRRTSPTTGRTSSEEARRLAAGHGVGAWHGLGAGRHTCCRRGAGWRRGATRAGRHTGWTPHGLEAGRHTGWTPHRLDTTRAGRHTGWTPHGLDATRVGRHTGWTPHGLDATRAGRHTGWTPHGLEAERHTGLMQMTEKYNRLGDKPSRVRLDHRHLNISDVYGVDYVAFTLFGANVVE